MPSRSRSPPPPSSCSPRVNASTPTRCCGSSTSSHPGGADLVSGLPSLLRSALALDDLPLAQRLSAGTQPLTPFHEHALASVQAQLTEAGGDSAAAAELYGQAAERWRKFADVRECAYALLGQGRCLAALGQPGAEEPLREAKELFTSMGYKPALAETEALLAETAAAAS